MIRKRKVIYEKIILLSERYYVKKMIIIEKNSYYLIIEFYDMCTGKKFFEGKGGIQHQSLVEKIIKDGFNDIVEYEKHKDKVVMYIENTINNLSDFIEYNFGEYINVKENKKEFIKKFAEGIFHFLKNRKVWKIWCLKKLY